MCVIPKTLPKIIPTRISRVEIMADKDSSEVMADTNSCVVKASSSFFDRQIMTNTAEHRRRKERENRKQGKKDEFWKYTPLLKAALKGDWETANKFFEQDPNLITAPITRELETALYMATGAGKKAIKFVTELLKLMPAKALAQRDIAGHTPLHLGSWVGNTKAAVLLVEKTPSLLCIRDNRGWLPIHYAAINAKKKTLSFLLMATYENDAATSMLFFSDSRSESEPGGAELLIHVITSGFYDLALDMVHRYPQLAISQSSYNDDCGLGAIARKVHAFPSGKRLKFFWEHIIYAYVSVKSKNYAEDLNRVEIEKPVNNSQLPEQKYHWAHCLGKIFFISVSQKSQAMLWKVFALLVPRIKHIQEKKQMHHHALHLLRYLVREMMNLNDLDAYDSLATDAIVNAARLGIHEVVEEIVESVPKLSCARDLENRSIFQLAVIERHEDIFNLIYQMTDHSNSVTMDIDEFGNNIMHLAGRLAPPNKLNLVSGAALQMQRELQWFKEVKKFVRPSYKTMMNNANETPAMVFTREHKDLVVKGGEWMKDTANSCTISAALIVTVVFAAIITVPGGSESSGLPIFSKEMAFIVFIISDSLSLFTSTTSLLLFLSILTSRYAEGDFLHVLPKRLIVGLFSLFLSITTMMVAFSFALYLVLGHKTAWILVPVAALACLPVTSFVSLQFPLLVDLIFSTYGHGIFGKKSNRQFY